jgi:WD40 repeat protein
MPGLRLVRGLAAEVLCVAPVGKDVWSGEREGGVAVRSLLTGEVKETITREYQFLVLCMRTVADHVWAGTETGVILVFDGRTRAVKHELRGHSGAVRTLAVGQPSGSSLPHVWSAGSDFSVCEWDAVRFKAVRSLRHTGGVRALALVSGLLWTGSDDNCVRVWSGAAVQATLKAHAGAITSLLASLTGTSVLSASEDGTLRRWAVRAPFEESGSPASAGFPVSSLVAVGSHLWVSGPNKVVVFQDANNQLVALREFKAGHAVSRVSVKETRVIWTSSILDKSIKIWRKTTTHEGAQESQAIADLQRKLQDVCRERDELKRQLESMN